MSIAIAMPGWIEEQRRRLADLTADLSEQVARHQSTITSVTGIHEFVEKINVARLQSLLVDEDEAASGQYWGFVEYSLEILVGLREFVHKNLNPGAVGTREFLAANNAILERFAQLAQTVQVSRPDRNLTLSADLEKVVWTIRISPFAYLRAMANLFWSAIRHPLSETTIDLSTGRVLYRT